MWKPGSWFAAEGGSRGARHLTQQLPNVKCQREDGVERPELQPETTSSGPMYTSRSNSWPTHPPTYLACPLPPGPRRAAQATPVHPALSASPSPSDGHTVPPFITHILGICLPPDLPQAYTPLGRLWLCPHPSHQVYSFLTPDCRPVHSAPVTSHRNFSQTTWTQLPTPTLTDQQPAVLIARPPTPLFHTPEPLCPCPPPSGL